MTSIPRALGTLGCVVLVVGFANGCHVGGDVTARPVPPPSPVPLVQVPTIATPAASPYYSKDNSVAITGMCNEGDTVILAGDASDRQTCVDSAFNFQVNKSRDGVYNILVTQMDVAQNVSEPVSFVWIRKTSIAPVALSTPTLNPYASAESTLEIDGACENGDTITLAGDGAGSTACINSTFSLTLPKAADGDYNIQIQQTDLAGNVATVPLLWKRHAVAASPANPSLVVNTSQLFTLSGGAGNYSIKVITNNSGGTLDAAHLTYTTGTTAYVTDVLRVTDGLGATTDIAISTQPGSPDHLMPAGGDAQSQSVGQVLASQISAKVVDQYGNGIPSYQLFFQVVAGDSVLTTPPIVATNVGGIAAASLKLGYGSPYNVLRVSPLTGTLPDKAATGNTTLTFTETSTTSGVGTLGLSFPAGASPGQMITADFNGDGIKDVAVVNQGDSTVTVMLGKGNGLFRTPSTYATCASPSGLAVGDFNNDGKLDIAVACNGVDSIRIFLGNGDGTFTNFGTFSTDAAPAGIVAADFDGDGKIDLIVASNTNSEIAVHLGNGDGTFGPTSTTYPSGLAPVAIATADLNKDGHPDVVTVNSGSSTISVFANAGTGFVAGTGFHPKADYAVGQGATAIAIGDLDADGYPDVVVANATDNTVTVHLNKGLAGPGILLAGVDTPVGTAPSAVAITDLNGDGKGDLLVANGADSTLGVLLSGSGGFFSAMTLYPVDTGPVALLPLDANGDGKTDVFVVNGGAQTLELFLGTGGVKFGLTTPVGSNPLAVANGDFDGDGKMDMAVLNAATNNVTILKGVGNGLFTTKATLLTGTSPTAIIAADFNRDGILDLAVTNSVAGTVRIYLGKGDGTFQTGVDYGVASQPVALVAQDFNHDGYLDLAVANNLSNSVSILLGKGDGTFNLKVDYQTGTSPAAVVAADFNRDGMIDLATANSNDGTVSVLLGNGNGIFQAKVDYPVGVNPIGLVTGDFSGHGYIDLVSLNSGESTVGILSSNGDGSFKAVAAFSCGGSATSIVTGDLNGDGKPDIVVANGVAQTFGVMFGAGAAVLNSPATYITTGNVNGIAIGDFNGDGALDVVTTDATNNAVQVWLGR